MDLPIQIVPNIKLNINTNILVLIMYDQHNINNNSVIDEFNNDDDLYMNLSMQIAPNIWFNINVGITIFVQHNMKTNDHVHHGISINLDDIANIKRQRLNVYMLTSFGIRTAIAVARKGG